MSGARSTHNGARGTRRERQVRGLRGVKAKRTEIDAAYKRGVIDGRLDEAKR